VSLEHTESHENIQLAPGLDTLGHEYGTLLAPGRCSCHTRLVDDRHELDDELRATIAARKHLGDDYEAALVQSFMEKVDREVDARAHELLARQPSRPSSRGRKRGGGTMLGLGSIALGIPVTAVASSNLHGVYGFAAVVVSWAAIAGVNIAHALGRR